MSSKKSTSGKSLKSRGKLGNAKSKGGKMVGKNHSSVKSKLASKSKSKSVKAASRKSTSSPAKASKSKGHQSTSSTASSSKAASTGVVSSQVASKVEAKSGQSKQSSTFSSSKSKAKQKSKILAKSKSKSTASASASTSTSAAASSTAKKSTKDSSSSSSSSSSARPSTSTAISKPRSAAATSLHSKSLSKAAAGELTHNSAIYRRPDSYGREWSSSSSRGGSSFQPFIGASMVIEHHDYDLDAVIIVVLETRGSAPQSSSPPSPLAPAPLPKLPPTPPPPPPPPLPADRRAGRAGARGGRVNLAEAAALLAPGPGLLDRAQRAVSTRTGQPVTVQVVPLTSTEDRERMRQKLSASSGFGAREMRVAIQPPYTEFSPITAHLVLTGYWGLVRENVARLPLPLGLVVNVTRETPRVAVDGLTFYRIPVDDAEGEDLAAYFDDITQRIRDFRERNLTTVVHCMVGVSRSASVVIAYLMRFEEEYRSLAAAFSHVRSVRTFVRPNLSFLRQLADYEAKVTGQRGPWREHTANGTTKSLPVFILENGAFLAAYAHEFPAAAD